MVVFEWLAAILTWAGCMMAVRVNGQWRWDSATPYALLFRQGIVKTLVLVSVSLTLPLMAGLMYLCFVSLFTVTTVVLNFVSIVYFQYERKQMGSYFLLFHTQTAVRRILYLGHDLSHSIFQNGSFIQRLPNALTLP